MSNLQIALISAAALVLIVLAVALRVGAWRAGKKRDADRRAAAERYYVNRAGVYGRVGKDFR